MIGGQPYVPGPTRAHIEKDGETWTLVLVREFRHAPDTVWEALTDPDRLREWAPFDADGSLDAVGDTVTLTTVNAPTPHVTESRVVRADKPRLLEYNWGSFNMRWQLEPNNGGTRLTLWTNIDRKYMAMGAAGWHLCFDVLDQYLNATPMGRMVGPEMAKFDGWQRLHAEYRKQFEREGSAQ